MPMPWTARAPTSTPMDGASAQAGDDAVNKVSPATRTRRLPSRSPADAAVSSTATVSV